jgi:hypothetical protein
VGDRSLSTGAIEIQGISAGLSIGSFPNLSQLARTGASASASVLGTSAGAMIGGGSAPTLNNHSALYAPSTSTPGDQDDNDALPPRLAARARFAPTLGWFPLMHRKLSNASSALFDALAHKPAADRASVLQTKPISNKVADLFACKQQLMELNGNDKQLALLESSDVALVGIVSRCLASIERLQSVCALNDSDHPSVVATSIAGVSTLGAAAALSFNGDAMDGGEYHQTGDDIIGDDHQVPEALRIPALPKARLPLQWTWISLSHKKARVSALYLSLMHIRGTLSFSTKPVREAIADVYNCRSQWRELLKNNNDVALLAAIDQTLPQVLHNSVNAINNIFEACNITVEVIASVAAPMTSSATATSAAVAAMGTPPKSDSLESAAASLVIPPIPRITYPLEWAWLPLMHKKIRAASIYISQLHESAAIWQAHNAKGVRAATIDLTHGKTQLQQLCNNADELGALGALDAQLPLAIAACLQVVNRIFDETEAALRAASPFEEQVWRKRSEEYFAEAEQLVLEIAIGFSDTTSAYQKLERLLAQLDAETANAQLPPSVEPQVQRVRAHIASTIDNLKSNLGQQDRHATAAQQQAFKTATDRFIELHTEAAQVTAAPTAKRIHDDLQALDRTARKLRASLPALERSYETADATDTEHDGMHTVPLTDATPATNDLLQRVDELLERIADTQRTLAINYQLSHNLLSLGRIAGMRRQVTKATAHHEALDDEMFQL